MINGDPSVQPLVTMIPKNYNVVAEYRRLTADKMVERNKHAVKYGNHHARV